MTFIANAADYELIQHDGNAATRHHLDWNGRLFITGYDGGSPEDWQAVHCTSHALAEIRAQHEFLGAVIARLEGES